MGLTAFALLTAVLSILVLDRMDAFGLGEASTRRRSASRYVFTVWAVAVAWLILLMGDGSSNFIYFQF
jgi:hypothetical protein